MKRGDVLKFGRVAFRVKDYRNESIGEIVDQDESRCPEDSVDVLESKSEQG